MKKLFFIVIVFLLAAPFVAEGFMMKNYPGYDYIPQPVLIAPTREKVVLTGKDKLEFKWSPREGRASGRECYDFRLYKGYDISKSTLIFKKKMPPDTYSIFLDSNFFENNQIYTWSLRQVYSGVGKNDRSFCSFKIIKK